MLDTFQTFSPIHPIIKQYVDYYYLDIKPYNELKEYQCFPHYNNTISIYKSHILNENDNVEYKENADACQIFTPIREQVLTVKQIGKVHRIVIVFHPLGIQQFYDGLNFGASIKDFDFLSRNELEEIFKTFEIETLTELLDNSLRKRFKVFNHPILEEGIQYIYYRDSDFSVESLSEHMGISRQHINRLFKLHLGVSAKRFADIYRFRQTINKKIHCTSEESLTELAHQFNFSDQSHFNKIYKTFTLMSPKNFFDKGTKLGNRDTFWHFKE
ncbi:MAG: helix-turn-helix domain-containing protein [Flavobacteriaceae bacterium]|jgi:AraC-like DNA-binding protein|nr:helix-turn-helix domain-containing protein [Flavobacteriaceae bacterium]